MFWKKDQAKWSIASKLTFLYVLSTLMMFIIIALFLYWMALKAVNTAEMQYLIDEIHIMQDLIKKHPHNLLFLKQEVEGVPPSVKNASYHYYVRIFDNKNQTIMITPDMKNFIGETAFPSISKENLASNIKYWVSDTGKHFLLISAPVAFDKTGQALLYAQVGLDGTYQHTLIRQYLHTIVLFLFLLTATVTVVGRWIAYKGLKELNRFAKVTEQVSIVNLSTRINLNHYPKELIPLGAAYNSMMVRLEDAFTRLSQCAAELAHELRTPINNLIGETEIALNKARRPEEYRHVLESNMEEYQRLSQLVENILFLAKTENPKMVISKIKFNVEEELNKICEFFNIIANEKQITIRFFGRAFLYAEPTLFRRAINNLLANAIRHTPSGGLVQLQISQEAANIIVAISDNGVGISEQCLPHIFECFYRINAQDSLHVSGAGLGLAIVKSIMELHQGKVTIESQLSQGTTVRLYFPLNEKN